ncbi:MAG: Mur ligase family protein [Bacteroidales bacterium]|jgi:UDP-N-acetylmuramate: L-alanyl-gamma-D-glutamyl-meso-diaminopimelate ligase|nr:Mur ligase family protein [Bacteroidales bacterium]
MRIHFIAIGGSAMHNLAITLHKKGYIVSGSDDEIFEPSKARLLKYDLLPKNYGWNKDKISNKIDAVILGMHAKEDNPELIEARRIGLKIYSYPEYLYEQTKDKIRVVISGSHGKTTITSMVMHVLKYFNKNFDYMVGAQLKGFETMVKLTDNAPIAIFEGDEYLSSPIDRRPKFHLYKPNIALISGIAWDHINVFPTFDKYIEQFDIFIDKIEKGGTLIYFEGDKILKDIVENNKNIINKIAYLAHSSTIIENKTYLLNYEKNIPLLVFGTHNLQNISGAKLICNKLGISDKNFYQAISNFEGAAKRLQLLAENSNSKVFLDFAHSPSKLKATVDAVKNQYPNKKLLACIELHTFSSLNRNFLKHYKSTMDMADVSIVYYNPDTLIHKSLKPLSENFVKRAFNSSSIKIFTEKKLLKDFFVNLNENNFVLLLMSSGNYAGINIKELAEKIINR